MMQPIQMQQPYRNYGPQPVVARQAHVPTPRRGGIERPPGPMMSSGPHPTVPLNQAQIAQQQQQADFARDQQKRRSRKPTDKALPDGVVEALIEPEVGENYNRLRDFERRLDATMTRKRLDIVDSVSRNAKRFRTLRIWVSNEVEDQPWQNNINMDSFDFTNNLESSYRVKVEGRLLDDDDDGEKEEAADKGAESADKMDTDMTPAAKQATQQPSKGKLASAKRGDRYRFSHFFKKMTVDYERSKARSGQESVVEWNKPDRTPAGSNLPAAADFDELTFKRNGDENVNITINLYRHEDPDRFKLSGALGEVVDMTEATRAEVIMGIWDYIKVMNLQEEEEKRNFRCDDRLRQIFHRESGQIPHLQEYITPHLFPLEPVKLEYTIRVDEEFHKSPTPTIYDVRVAVDDPLRAKLVPFMHNPQYAVMLKEVAGLDDQLATLVQAISASKAKHAFLTAMCDDPVGFVRDWLSSQKRDLEVIMGEATRGGGEDATGDEWRKGGHGSIWASEHARESVNMLLAKQPAIR